MPLDLIYDEGSLSPKSTDSLCLLVAQVPRPRDMAIFVLTTTTTLPITLPLAHARGVINVCVNHTVLINLMINVMLILAIKWFDKCHLSTMLSKLFNYTV